MNIEFMTIISMQKLMRALQCTNVNELRGIMLRGVMDHDTAHTKHGALIIQSE